MAKGDNNTQIGQATPQVARPMGNANGMMNNMGRAINPTMTPNFQANRDMWTNGMNRMNQMPPPWITRSQKLPPGWTPEMSMQDPRYPVPIAGRNMNDPRNQQIPQTTTNANIPGNIGIGPSDPSALLSQYLQRGPNIFDRTRMMGRMFPGNGDINRVSPMHQGPYGMSWG